MAFRAACPGMRVPPLACPAKGWAERGSPMGWSAIAHWSHGLRKLCDRGGLLLLEIGWDQGRSVPAELDADGRFEAPEVLPDLAGRDRVVAAVRR